MFILKKKKPQCVVSQTSALLNETEKMLMENCLAAQHPAKGCVLWSTQMYFQYMCARTRNGVVFVVGLRSEFLRVPYSTLENIRPPKSEGGGIHGIHL